MKKILLICACFILAFTIVNCGKASETNIRASENNTVSNGGAGNNDAPNTSATPPSNDAPADSKTEKSGIESIYTDLAAEKCKTIESDETGAGWYRGECKGVGGFKLEVLEGDIRQSINVIFPNGKKSELEFWSIISGAFSYVGDKAEWRVIKDGEKIKPFALIVRFNASENPEKPEKPTSYLSVSKITNDAACITDIVNPSKDQNEKARQLADRSADKPCLKPSGN